jgi:hypothetical protein
MKESNESHTLQPNATAVPSDAMSFALMLEAACQDFETLDRIVRGEIKIVLDLTATAQGPQPAWALEQRAKASVTTALAKSFLFYVARAKRICAKNSQFLRGYSEDRKFFLKYLNSIGLTDVRDVNEHGFDPDSLPDSRPSIHVHGDGNIALDETGVIVLDGKILLGPINLYDVYPKVKNMRDIGGFSSPSFQQARQLQA